MAKVLSGRVDDDLAAWVESYANERGVSRTAVLEAALRGLQVEAKGGLPEMPEPERVPSPAESGTAHWRDPSGAEVADAVARHPELTDAQAVRLARAEARQTDMGLPQAPANPVSDEPADLARGVPRQGGDFSMLTRARGAFFAGLRTPGSISGKTPRAK